MALLVVNLSNVVSDTPSLHRKLLMLLAELVQLADQLHVLFQNALVLLRVLLRLFLQLVLQRLYIVFYLGSLLVVHLVNIRRALVVHTFVEHPGAIKAHNALFQFLVSHLVLEKHLLDVVLEVLDDALLPVDLTFHCVCSLC